jgi:aspartate racemase
MTDAGDAGDADETSADADAAAGPRARADGGAPAAQRTVGILGGMSYHSTLDYYREVNAGVNDALGGHHSADLLVSSVDFGPVEALMREGDFDALGERLAARARGLEAGGAEAVLLATNTMHRVAPAIEAALSVPFVHIVDVTAEAVREAGHERVGLLGTRFTMGESFARDRFAENGVEVVVPDAADRELVDDVVFDELVHGVVREESRAAYRRVVADLLDRGAEGVVFGCTEIGMLLDRADVDAPVFDTTERHVARAVDLCLGRVDP